MYFFHKVILIISSERWGKIFISKHHYALTLAELGNRVFFLNPMDENLGIGEIRVEESSLSKNLHIVTYRSFFPWIFKFHITWLFDILIKIQLKKILKKLAAKIDVVWDFNCSYVYNDLSVFNAELNIFHPVDKMGADTAHKKADIVFSVSPLILEDYRVPGVPRFLLNHGLSKKFQEIAMEAIMPVNYSKKKITVGYIGNIIQPSMDRAVIKEIILTNPEVEFYFIGPYTSGNNIYNDYKKEDELFVNFLKSYSNVTLTGTLTTGEIANEIKKFDVFFICYKNSQNYRCDNSHKVLEYLSTGKAVISTPILYYENSDLLIMSKSNEEYAALFVNIISNLSFYNSIDLMEKRKAFALENTYEKQILKINKLVNEHLVL